MSKKLWIALFLLLPIFAGLVGLKYVIANLSPKNETELYGTYVHDSQLAYQELILHANGTYEQTVKIKGIDEELSTDGKWVFRTETRRSGRKSGYANFYKGFILVFDRYNKLNPKYKTPASGIVSMPAQYWLGALTLWDGEARPSWEKVE